MDYPTQYFDQDKTKFSHELCQILDEVAHGGPALGCFRKFRPDVIRPADQLSGSELAFRLIAEGDSDAFMLELFRGGILWRPSQWSSHYLDSFFLEDLPVILVKVDFVTEESSGSASEPVLEPVDMHCQVGTSLYASQL